MADSRPFANSDTSRAVRSAAKVEMIRSYSGPASAASRRAPWRIAHYAAVALVVAVYALLPFAGVLEFLGKAAALSFLAPGGAGLDYGAQIAAMVATAIGILVLCPWLDRTRWPIGAVAVLATVSCLLALTQFIQSSLQVAIDPRPLAAMPICLYLAIVGERAIGASRELFVRNMAVAHRNALLQSVVENSAEGIFVVNGAGTSERFIDQEQAFDVARRRAEAVALETARTNGADDPASLLREEIDAPEVEGSRKLIEARFIASASGRPRIAHG